jgi:transcriptional regulator with XRE-family HTH domain
MGLRQLCRLADISPASLTAIEKGQSSPTLATLQKILKALGSSFSEFFTNTIETPAEPVWRRKDMRTAADDYRRYTFLLPKSHDKRFEMISETILPTEPEAEWELHECDVGGVIINGGPAQLEIQGQGTWKIRKGDSFYVRAGLKHRLLNLGRGPIKQITVMDPPRY